MPRAAAPTAPHESPLCVMREHEISDFHTDYSDEPAQGDLPVTDGELDFGAPLEMSEPPQLSQPLQFGPPSASESDGDEAFGEPEVPRDVPGAIGNRPAAGARMATPGQVLGEDFHGSDNAGDFLGLDVDFEPPSGLELAGAPSVPAPAPAIDDEPGHAAAFDDGFDDDVATGPDDGFGADDPADDDELLGFDELVLAPAPARGRTGLFVGVAFMLGLAGVLAFVYGPQALERFGLTGTEQVAVQPPPRPARETAPVAADPAEAEASEPEVIEFPLDDEPSDVGTGFLASGDGSELLDGEAGTSDVDPLEVADAGGSASASAQDGAVEPDAGATTSAGDGTGTVTEFPLEGPTGTTVVRVGGDPLAGEDEEGGAARHGFDAGTLVPELLTSLEWAGQEDLDMLWRGTNVPMEAIASPARILMPRVGQVRIRMESGELFFGKMVAAGRQRVWIDVEQGRIALDGPKIVSIDRMAPGAAVEASAPVAMGKRVRVTVPGGYLFGRVLSEREGEFTIQPDQGGRVVLTSPVIEEVGSSRAIIVRE